jgi:F-type H+-transporting ATPase subunit gamma
MPSLKEYNVKLARLRNTRKMTKTMKLVSVNKLRRAQEAEKRAGRFAANVTDIMAQVGQADGEWEYALLTPRKAVGSVLMLTITSDRGLCGGFNNTLIKAVAHWNGEQTARGRAVLISCCGRKGHTFFKSRARIERYYEEASAHPEFQGARRIGHELQAAFLSGRVDEVHLAYNMPKGMLSQTVTIERLLPIDPASLRTTAGHGTAAGGRDGLLDPSRGELMEALLPRFICLKIYSALLSSAAGEHSARMRAMDQASSNADNLIKILTLQRNRARQAEITTELIEIVAGAEALK